MEGHKIKIICNPYKNEVSYQQWSEGGWVPLAPASELMRDKKYQETNLQHNGYDIVHMIEKKYNRGTAGLEIVFEGTNEDYNEIKSLVGQFPEEAMVSCSKGNAHLLSAAETMPNITAIFEQLKELLASCADGGEITRVLDKFSDVTRTTIPVCVTGTYSAGKSAFINALIGAEVLPSGTDPTTSRIYKIHRSDNGAKVTFSYNDHAVTIEYEDNQFKVSECPVAELGAALEKAIKNAKQNDIADSIYCSLQEINSYANQDALIDPLVEVEIPFGSSLLNCEDYDFVIYDTPGSNSANHKDHLQVLKKYLNNQTNGLPIVITTRQSMDSNDNEQLVELLNSISENLDMSNAMVVVNRADELNPKSLEKISGSKEQTASVLSTWKSNRLYYVSSVVGLGSKKNGDNSSKDWRNDDYGYAFDNIYQRFIPVENQKYYAQLYKYNEIPDNKKTAYMDAVAGVSDEAEFLYINSGIHCVETDIIEYAKKIALYNKCNRAQEYLQEGIHVARDMISKQEIMKQDAVRQVQSHLSEKEQELIHKLEEYTDDETEDALKKHPNALVPTIQKAEERLHKIQVDQLWKEAKQKHKEEGRSRVVLFTNYCNRTITEEKNTVFHDCMRESSSFFEERKRRIQDGCCKIVMDTSFLSDNEKNFIKAYIMNLDMRMPYVQASLSSSKIQKHFFGFAIDKVDVKKAKAELIAVIEDATRTQIHTIKDNHVKAFREWIGKLREGLSGEMGRLNPDLMMMSQKIELGEQEIDLLKDKIVTLTGGLKSISELFEFQTR